MGGLASLKTMRARFFKRLTISFGALIGIGIFSAALSACGAYQVIDARGSSSVQPFLNELAADYTNPQQYPHRKVEISVQAGGSALGITSILNQQTMIGMASKSPKPTITKNNLADSWKQQQIKTITLAKDGIALLLYAPAGYTNTDFVIKNNNIDQLYKAFAGYDRVSLSTLLNDQAKASELNNFYIHGFARSGGSSSSGTAEAFYLDSGLTTQRDKYTANVIKALENGIYGPNTTQTNESNAEAYNNFAINAPSRGYGSMIYLSLGYVENHMQQIKNDGFIVVAYQKNSTENNQVVEATIKNVEVNAYSWIRPFNVMVSLARIQNEKTKNNQNYLEDFINWILFSKYGYQSIDQSSSDEASKIISTAFNNEGVIALSDTDVTKMFLTNNNDNENNGTQIKIGDKNYSLDRFWQPDYAFNNGTGMFGV